MFTEQYKTRHFELELEKHLPPARLDEDKFQQVMTNLIDNAAKYSVNGITVLVSTCISENIILIKLKDEGVGLYITKQLVERMHGDIDFESEEGKGTVFIVRFPVYNQEEALRCSHIS